MGEALKAKLAKCGINTIANLLFHLPFRYQDRTRITPICDLRANDWAVIAGKVCKTEISYGKRSVLSCYIQDKTGILKLRFFHFNKQQAKALRMSPVVRIFGEIRAFANTLEMVHPEYQLLADGADCVVEETLTPIYPITQGLTQKRLRQLVKFALISSQEVLNQLEWLSLHQLSTYQLLPLSEALNLLHNPPPDISLRNLEEGTHPAMRRLVFDELVGHRVAMQLAREHRRNLIAPIISCDERLHEEFIHQLPFQLTQAQERVNQEIASDLSRPTPMLRLVQGDVGSGKTIIAALAALQAIANGYQVAFMAPTELLSEQHAVNLENWLNPLGLTCRRLTSKMKKSKRKETLKLLANNNCHLLVGTHALFQEEVLFANLGLIIIDEQHRFGVEQRLLLQQKGQNESRTVHQLLLTATPIPRTLAMTQFAHLDLSIIDELPPGRRPITTAVLSQEKRIPIINRLQEAIAEGRQAYWVCPLIEKSEKLQCIAATVTAQNLQEQLADKRIGLIHGRMKPEEKETVMAAFKLGEIDLLVATTVIEVGVDVANASLMIIENSERLGLAQLHQLRGRVGRGSEQSHCLLLYQPPLTQLSAERLKIMRETNDGFIIAEKDLQLRGAGEFLGIRQAGYRQFKLANLQRDKAMLPIVSSVCKNMVTSMPHKATEIAQRWRRDFHHYLQG